jgi:hypothetical protein
MDVATGMPTPLMDFHSRKAPGLWRGTTPQGGPGKKQLGNAFLRSGRNYTRVTSPRLQRPVRRAHVDRPGPHRRCDRGAPERRYGAATQAGERQPGGVSRSYRGLFSASCRSARETPWPACARAMVGTPLGTHHARPNLSRSGYLLRQGAALSVESVTGKIPGVLVALKEHRISSPPRTEGAQDS